MAKIPFTDWLPVPKVYHQGCGHLRSLVEREILDEYAWKLWSCDQFRARGQAQISLNELAARTGRDRSYLKRFRLRLLDPKRTPVGPLLIEHVPYNPKTNEAAWCSINLEAFAFLAMAAQLAELPPVVIQTPTLEVPTTPPLGVSNTPGVGNSRPTGSPPERPTESGSSQPPKTPLKTDPDTSTSDRYRLKVPLEEPGLPCLGRPAGGDADRIGLRKTKGKARSDLQHADLRKALSYRPVEGG